MMQRFSLVAALLLAAMPVAAVAQSPSPMMSPMMSPTPMMSAMPMTPRMRPTMSPDMKMKIEQARTSGRIAAYAALSPSHRSQVQAIVAQVNANKLDVKAGTDKIDAVLTYNEAKAILAAAGKAMMMVHGPGMGMHGPGGPGGMPTMRHCHDDMMGGSPMPMPPSPMGSPMPMASGMMSHPMPMHHGMMHGHGDMMMHGRPPDAGKVMLLLAVSSDKAMMMMRPMPGMHGMHDGMHSGMPMPPRSPGMMPPPMAPSMMPMPSPTP